MTDSLNSEELKSILADFRHEDAKVRKEALSSLLQLGTKQAMPANLEGVNTKSWLDNNLAQFYNQPEVADALLGAMEDSSSVIRAMAALEVWRIQSERPELALIGHLKQDTEPRMRMICAKSLEYIKTPAALESLINALRDAIEPVICFACLSLGRKGDPLAIEPLREVSLHPSWDVRYSAFGALIEMNGIDEQTLTKLEHIASHPEAAEHDKQRDRIGRKSVFPTWKELFEKAQGSLARSSAEGDS
jgi:HEAT repeat protein